MWDHVPTHQDYIAPNHGLVTDTTNPHLLVDTLGEDVRFTLKVFFIAVFFTKTSPIGTRVPLKLSI